MALAAAGIDGTFEAVPHIMAPAIAERDHRPRSGEAPGTGPADEIQVGFFVEPACREFGIE